MIDTAFLEVFYEHITSICLDCYEKKETDVISLAEKCMDINGLPMHCPPHHYMIPAVLLTVCHKLQGHPMEYLKKDLEEANQRAHNVLGGFCGFYGSCGAAVGVGIFMSIFTDTEPCSEKTWSWTNRATAEALMAISKIDGPRCCKRNSYLALSSACDTAKKYLSLDIPRKDKIICRYYKLNNECKGRKCPYFPEGRDEK